jgi:hypothetical protein
VILDKIEKQSENFGIQKQENDVSSIYENYNDNGFDNIVI